MDIRRFFKREQDENCEENDKVEKVIVCRPQTHVHEFISSTQLAEEGEGRHNHRFAGVSDQMIPIPGSHVHRFFTRTDFLDHFHLIDSISGPAIPLPDHDAGASQLKHVHLVEGFTTIVDDHQHEFEFGTLVQALLADKD